MLREKMKRINITLNKSLLEEVDKIAEMRLEDRSTAVRQLLQKSLKEEKIEKAIEEYKNQGMTLRQAARLSDMGYWEFQTEMAKRGIPLMSGVIPAEKRMKYVLEKK